MSREVWWEVVDWIRLAQDTDSWWALVYTNEPPGSMKGGEFLDELSDFWLLKKDSSQCS